MGDAETRAHLDLNSLPVTSRTAIRERLETIERAVLSSRPGRPADGQVDEARRELHKLAGLLGILGLARAANIAGELERLLQAGGDSAGRDRELAAQLRAEVEGAFTGVQVG